MSGKVFRTPVYRTLLLLLVILTGYQNCLAQKQRIRFQHITSDEGLSNNTVETICQDKRGFMWFGTRDGLNRYDGINVVVFRNSLQNKSSISQNLINDIYEDRSGALWIATSEALDLFIPETETFQHFSPDKSITAVNDIAEDRNGQLWVGTNKGLFRFDRRKHTFSRFNNTNFGTVNKILADSKGNLWLGTESGLYCIKQQDGSVKYFRAQTGNPASLQSPIIHEVFEDSRGRIWIGMSEGGLALFNATNGTFTTFKADPRYIADPEHTNSLPHNDIRSVVEGEPGILWVGTENGGLCVFNTDKNTFITYKPSNTDGGSLSHDSLHSLYKDKQGNIWIGTWAGGVNFFSHSLLKFQLYNKFPAG
jgi:ligand-binding sensor domain-containing protein